MNKHIIADRLATGLGGLYGERMKFFREGTESPHVSTMLKGLEVDFTPPAGPGEYRVPVRWGDGNGGDGNGNSGDGSNGNGDGGNGGNGNGNSGNGGNGNSGDGGGGDGGGGRVPGVLIEGVARYDVLQWKGSEAETLIYHHGSGESNYSARIRRIARKAGWNAKNVIALSVPFNASMREYLYGVGSLRRFAFMLASSVGLTEELVGYLRSIGNERIVCAGMSLGGWITNLHHSCYDTCSAYKPIFAGAAPDHLFSGTVYRRMLAKAADPAEISEALNFEADFAARDNGSVFPCMARYDQYVVLGRQSKLYRPENVRIIERGHVTGAAAYRELAEHLS